MRRWLTARTLVVFALALIVFVFAVLHLAGARHDVGILSGTVPASDTALVSGLAYVVAWFATVLVVPIALLTLLIELVWRRLQARQQNAKARTVLRR